jgi:hypothetical protein
VRKPQSLVSRGTWYVWQSPAPVLPKEGGVDCDERLGSVYVRRSRRGALELEVVCISTLPSLVACKRSVVTSTP